MKTLRSFFIMASLTGAFISSVDSAKIHFDQSNIKVQEIQEMQRIDLSNVPDHAPPRNLALFTSSSLKKVKSPDICYVDGM
jgi:hypothetical protein